MNQKTALAQALEIAGSKAKYDAEVKNILSDKIVLAWILKNTASEFTNETINSIIELIEDEPEIASVPVYPGKTNQSKKISGMSTDDKVPNEGEITYDIRFFVYTPDKENRLKLIINVEAQKDYTPGYDIVTRGVYYCSRTISSQKEVEFTGSNYNDIKKVYSIWICIDTPDYISNTVTSYEIKPRSIYGNYNGENSRYDLLNVTTVCIGKMADKSDFELIRFLDTLLSNELSVEIKKKILANDFGIESLTKMETEMNVMCNLSDLVEEKGIKKGVAQNMVEMIDKLAQNTGFEEALRLLDVTQEKYDAAKELIAQASKN